MGWWGCWIEKAGRLLLMEGQKNREENVHNKRRGEKEKKGKNRKKGNHKKIKGIVVMER